MDNEKIEWDAEVQYNEATSHFELFVYSSGTVLYMAYSEDDVYDWAEANGFTTEDTWGDPSF